MSPLHNSLYLACKQAEEIRGPSDCKRSVDSLCMSSCSLQSACSHVHLSCAEMYSLVVVLVLQRNSTFCWKTFKTSFELMSSLGEGWEESSRVEESP